MFLCQKYGAIVGANCYLNVIGTNYLNTDAKRVFKLYLDENL